MLDFYTIPLHLPMPDYPEKSGLKFVGGINDKTFYHLQKIGIISKDLDYYSDFKLDTKAIQQIKQCIFDKNLQYDSDVEQLIQIIEKAEQGDFYLAAYGD